MTKRANAWAVGDIETLAQIPEPAREGICADAITSAPGLRDKFEAAKTQVENAWFESIEASSTRTRCRSPCCRCQRFCAKTGAYRNSKNAATSSKRRRAERRDRRHLPPNLGRAFLSVCNGIHLPRMLNCPPGPAGFSRDRFLQIGSANVERPCVRADARCCAVVAALVDPGDGFAWIMFSVAILVRRSSRRMPPRFLWVGLPAARVTVSPLLPSAPSRQRPVDL